MPATPSRRCRSSDAKKVITVRGTAFEAVAAEGGSAAIEAVAGKGDAGLSSYVGSEISSNPSAPN